ncbi:MAG: SAVED domain-containing protein [Planctomycetes bacterium]|nr:SAVED domain-containing protein [Planctomycetota bacterium]
MIDHFQIVDSGLPGVYRHFTLACPSFAPKLRPVETGLARFRNAKPFYDDASDALVPTKHELDQRLRKNGLADYIDFIHAKVFIEIGHGDLRHDDRALELFIARLLTHPEYAGRLRAMVQPAFAELMRAIGASKGVVLERAHIEKILRVAVASAGHHEKGITVWIQNWTKESLEPKADHSLDWSSHFDRTTRRVPSFETWNNDLLPELRSLQKRITAEHMERLIRLRGKCALSTGIALGSAFPGVGGWVFEIPQFPSKTDWRSDATATSPYELRVEVIDGDKDGADIVLGLNIRGDGRQDIIHYVESTGIRPRILAFVSPTSQGAQSISGAEDACALARAVREELGQLLKEHRLNRTRIFFYGPFALAVFLGQQLTSVGEVQLFEYQDPGYVPSFMLRT